MTTAIADKLHDMSARLPLSQREVGDIVGTSPRTVSRWATGAATPQLEAKRRLLALAEVVEQLTQVLRPEAANHWLFTPNRMLDNDTPADRIRDGDAKSVLALVAALADAVAFSKMPADEPDVPEDAVIPSFNHEPESARRFRERGFRSTLTVPRATNHRAE